MKKSLIMVLLVLITMSMLNAQGTTEAKGAYPDRPVEFVAPASAGGGTDTFCRLIVDIINKNKLVDGNVVVVNKPGGGGTVGAAYAADPNRDGNYTLVALNGAQVLGLRASTEVNATDLVPIAALAMDNVLFVAATDSPYKSFADVIAAAKKNPGGISVGVADNLDRLCVEMINQEAGIQLNGVYFDSAGEISSAMLGGHVAFGIMNPNECIGQIQANMMAALASFSETRLDGVFASAPTFAELGYPNVKFQMFRGIMGGKGMTEETVAYWSKVFEQVAATEQWKTNYIKKSALDGTYMGADKFGPYATQNSEQLFQMGKKIGLFE
ncbi:tripartite tricarboxylate transporter substrate binding protein [Sphaerochaeta sp.]|uniref:tripartite tricarboxylate transporter substrate binding protein n=1 Tax=Sphaerochaeta sp. TaxID=1972642 RepID=UPI002FCA9583